VTIILKKKPYNVCGPFNFGASYDCEFIRETSGVLGHFFAPVRLNWAGGWPVRMRRNFWMKHAPGQAQSLNLLTCSPAHYHYVPATYTVN